MDLDLVNRIDKFIVRLSQERFYGMVELQFVDGEIVLIRKQETIKPGLLVVID